MKILVTGASGLVGTYLVPSLAAKGHDVLKVGRGAAKSADEVQWNPETGFADSEIAKLEGIDAVVHLAGDNVGAENWSAEKKRKIRDSRVKGTRVLVDALAKLKKKPATFVSASASGYYGPRGDEILTEESPKGEGFLADTCAEWEAEADRASELGARVVKLRIGVVLAKEGGALEKMMTPFKFGVGGVVGSGKQWMPWISLDDLVRAFEFALENESLQGPYNTIAPGIVNNEGFTKVFGDVINRPTILPIPEFAIRLMFGEMGEQLLLKGQRMTSAKLIAAGFEFKFPELKAALEHVLA